MARLPLGSEARRARALIAVAVRLRRPQASIDELRRAFAIAKAREIRDFAKAELEALDAEPELAGGARFVDAAKRNAPGLILVGGAVGTPVLVGPATAAVVIVGLLVVVVILCTRPANRADVALLLLLVLVPWAHKAAARCHCWRSKTGEKGECSRSVL